MFQAQRKAALLGLLAAAVPPAALVGSAEPSRFSLFAIAWYLFLYGVSLLVVSILGLPALYITAKLGVMRSWLLALEGLVVGVLFAFVIGGAFQPFAMILYGLSGLMAALVFCVFWNRGPNPTAEEARKWVLSFTRFG